MADKKIKSWFMRNIILPNNEIIDKPGYIISIRFSGKQKSYLREVLLPEKILSNLELEFVKKYKKKGEKALYTAGKMWGIRFASTMNLPRKSKLSKKDFTGFVDSLMKLLQSEYATNVEYEYDYDSNFLRFIAKGLMVCRISGVGLFLLGTLAGTFSYLCEDPKIEGIHPKCQGRGDKKCVMDYSTPKKLGKSAIKIPLKHDSKLGIEREYSTFNKIKKSLYARNSFKDLLYSRIVEYVGGFFLYKKDRMLINEASSLYFLETELSKLKGGEDLIFKISSNYSKKLSKKSKSPAALSKDILPAFGWGDFKTSSPYKKVFVMNYPWTKYYKDTNYPIICGLISGLVSAEVKKDVKLKKVKRLINLGSLNLVLEE